MKELVNQMKLQKDVYVIGLGTIGGLFVFGTILHEIIAAMDDHITEVFCMGSTMSLFGMFVAMLFGVVMHMVYVFNYAISMGRTRKRFLPAYTASVFFTALVLEAVLVLMHFAERLRLGLMYPDLRIDDPAANVLHWNILLAAALFLTALGVCSASLVIRFGKIALWLIWMGWTAVCVALPHVIEMLFAHMDNAVVKVVFRVAGWFFGLGGAAVPALAFCLGAVLLGVSFLLLRRQQVSL